MSTMLMVLVFIVLVVGALVFWSKFNKEAEISKLNKEAEISKLKMWEKQTLAQAEKEGKGVEHARQELMKKVNANNEGLTPDSKDWIDPDIAAIGAFEQL